MMFLAGVSLWLFIGAGAAAGAALPVVWSLMHDYQKKRVMIFLDPASDPLGAGYHITQSKIAIGSGGLFGKGFLHGTQSHLDYLPELHTDFIFATMAEEWGLAGGLLILAGFSVILVWAVRVAFGARAQFSRLAAMGLAVTLFFYLAINMMMVTGLAPVVGIPLPLVSYGGSAMMTVLILLGIVMSVARSKGEALPR
jgi:rod shape determining protein RodA